MISEIHRIARILCYWRSWYQYIMEFSDEPLIESGGGGNAFEDDPKR